MSENLSTAGAPVDGSSATPGAPPAELMSVPEACFSVFFAPSRVFAERQTRDWVIPLIILTVLVSLLFYGTKPYMQPALDAGIGPSDGGDGARQSAVDSRADRRHPQHAGQVRHSGRGRWDPRDRHRLAILLWVIGRFVESKQTVKAAFVVATFAYFPKVLSPSPRLASSELPGTRHISLGYIA